MALLDRLRALTATDIGEMIDQAEKPLDTARQAIRLFESDIGHWRREVYAARQRVQRTRRQLDQAQAEAEAPRQRAESCFRQGDEEGAERALARKAEVEAAVKKREADWWLVCQDLERAEEQLRACEDKAQSARRSKETLSARKRAGRSSSDFIPVPPVQSEPEVEPDVEAELAKLKRRQADRAGEDPGKS